MSATVLSVAVTSAAERRYVVIIVIDATEGVTEQDAKIAGIAHDRGKGIIIAVNKWDAIEKDNNTVRNIPRKSVSGAMQDILKRETPKNFNIPETETWRPAFWAASPSSQSLRDKWLPSFSQNVDCFF